MTDQAAAAAVHNAAVGLLTRNLDSRADKVAFIDADGAYTYAAVADRSVRTGAALRSLGLSLGDRVVLVMQDGVDFVCAFLGSIRAGLVPVPLNTLLTAADYAYLLTDSGAAAVVASEVLEPVVRQAVAQSGWPGRVVIAGPTGEGSLAEIIDQASSDAPAHPCRADDIAFWLYSSGSTGRPKGTLHRHASLAATAERYSRQVFGLGEADVVFSAAKLFFAYGLGNALTFPMYAGATAVLYPGRVTPEVVANLLARHEVSIFCGVPTLYATMLSEAAVSRANAPKLRLCMSAGEALPAEVARAWTRATGTEVIDGIGSTEMLHIFVSNRPGSVRHGATGRPTPGYETRLVDEAGQDVGSGEIGDLLVRGPSMAAGYWNQPEKTRATFQDGWVRTGDKFEADVEGYLIYRGRSDDMIKVSGIWVSPVEVEAALIEHDGVLEVAVIGVEDQTGLVKTKAFVTPAPGVVADEALAEDLKRFAKARLAPYKYPRAVAFVDALPKTATGKIRRHLLRDQEAAAKGSEGR